MPQKWTSRFELKPGTWVFVPSEESRALGNELKAAVEARWEPPANYYHLGPGGHLLAVRAHLSNTFFAHLDIQNFFGKVNASRVTRWLTPLFGYVKAREYALASTVKHPTTGESMLPFGYVQSPIIASLCLAKSALGKCLQELGPVTVSVYVDDIILSSDDEEALSRAVAAVEAAASRARLSVHPEKKVGPALEITAFNIMISHDALSIEPARMQEFSAAFRSSESEHARAGIHGYVAAVNPVQAATL